MKTKFKFKTQLLVFAYVMLAVIFLVGCDEKKQISNIKNEYNLKAGGCPMKIYVVDGCEYIGRVTAISYGNFLTHKGNCKFCLARHAK